MSKLIKQANIVLELDDKNVTFRDLKDFVENLEFMGVPDDEVLDICSIYYCYTNEFEYIVDGDSVPGNPRNDILVELKF
jgi:hypothetical protein